MDCQSEKKRQLNSINKIVVKCTARAFEYHTQKNKIYALIPTKYYKRNDKKICL